MSRQKRYYIIDDDSDDQQFLIEALKENDTTVQCFTASAGKEAISNLKQMSSLPDAIFLDQNMPGLSGSQCLVELKRTVLLQRIPVIIYSTSLNKTEVEKVMQLGAFRFLVKSFSFSELKKELLSITTALEKFTPFDPTLSRVPAKNKITFIYPVY